MYPKPKHRRKTPKPKRNKMPTINDLCEVCMKPYAHCHEVFFGEKHRKWSILYSLTKRLCYEHHNMPGGVNPHHNREVDLLYKRESQARFEEEYSHELFMQLFGRNYIDW